MAWSLGPAAVAVAVMLQVLVQTCAVQGTAHLAASSLRSARGSAETNALGDSITKLAQEILGVKAFQDDINSGKIGTSKHKT